MESVRHPDGTEAILPDAVHPAADAAVPVSGRIRRYDIDLPAVIAERIEQILESVKRRGLLPEHIGVRDFITGTIIANGLMLVEADLKQREVKTRAVLLPEELNQWQKASRSQSMPSGPIIRP